jgi:hypothetical protein
MKTEDNNGMRQSVAFASFLYMRSASSVAFLQVHSTGSIAASCCRRQSNPTPQFRPEACNPSGKMGERFMRHEIRDLEKE